MLVWVILLNVISRQLWQCI